VLTVFAPTRHDLEEIYADYLPLSQRPSVDAVHNDELIATIKAGLPVNVAVFVSLLCCKGFDDTQGADNWRCQQRFSPLSPAQPPASP
jgi:hypothetical protein